MYANCTGTAFPNWRIFPFQTIRKVWADWSSAAGCPAAERREAHSSHLWTEGESAHGLPGAVSDEYGQFRSPLRDGLAPAR